MKVSVLCMTYNHEKYIRSALEGFVSQKTDFDYEVIVHDDASTDGTADIIREYAEKYPHIIKPIYQTENQYSKRNASQVQAVWQKIRGRYIALCEGDDYWIDENKLQMQVDFLDRNPEYSACVHNSYRLDMMTNQKTVMFDEVDRDIETVPVIRYGITAHYQTASLMYRKEYMADPPPFLKYGMDYAMAIFLTLKGPIRFLGKIMSVYRYGSVGSFTTRNRKDMHKQVLHFEYLNKMLRELNENTNYAFQEVIEEKILENNYHALYFGEKYSEMRAPEYRELYRKESMTKRVKMQLKQYFAPIYHLYRKLKY